jgi:GT2 family glycosyltransferase
MGLPRISVCIANFNGEAMLGDCIDSVLAQDTDASIEILVHDDASTDSSVALLRQRYPQVRLIAATENVGFCVANNRMVDAASGEYVLLLNNDAALFPDGVGVLLAEATRLAKPAILTLPQFDWTSGALVDRGCLLDPFHAPVPNLDPDRHDVAYVIGACLWIPRAMFSELGGFPAWLGSIAEDMYVCCAARLRGVSVRCLANSGYRHRQGASFGGNRLSDGLIRTTYRRRHLSERNRIAVLVACTPGVIAWPWLAIHVAALVAESALLCLSRANLQPWRDVYRPALRDTWSERANLHFSRIMLQKVRSTTLRDYVKPFTPMPRKLSMLLKHGLPRFDLLE